MSTITQLAQLISTSVESLNKTCSKANIHLSSLDKPFSASVEASLMAPEALQAAHDIIMNALKLVAAVSPAQMTLFRMATATLGTAIRCHVPEILRNADSKGMHIDDIARQTDVDTRKLSPVLPYLASNNVFREVSPNVFANNRLSGALDTGKDVAGILQSSLTKHDATNGFTSWIETMYILSSCMLLEFPHPFHCPLAHVSDNLLPLPQWLAQPEQRYLLKRWSAFASGFLPDMIWTRSIAEHLELAILPQNAVIVDIATSPSMPGAIEIAKLYPNMKFIVQQPAVVIDEANKMWRESGPQIAFSGLMDRRTRDLRSTTHMKCFALHPEQYSFILAGSVTSEIKLFLTAVLMPEHSVPDATNAVLTLLNVMIFDCTNNHEHLERVDCSFERLGLEDLES
ncbi:hypothetical protein C8J56DRAFT_1049313 [Mycena floridula]|nr:hypothetical protein C8J56DRAFT_1049313 [Mycena floridula]